MDNNIEECCPFQELSDSSDENMELNTISYTGSPHYGVGAGPPNYLLEELITPTPLSHTTVDQAFREFIQDIPQILRDALKEEEEESSDEDQ